VAALVVIAGAAVFQRLDRPVPPPVLGEVPGFSLTNRDGRTVTLADLAGRPWVADFIFTRCPASCPMMTARMARLGRELPEGAARLVSFTVDPAHDTPEALARYAAAFEGPADWLFLTGGAEELHRLSREGFKLAVDPAPPPDMAGAEPILHSTRFVLVDGEARIRGYYDAFDEESMKALERDLAALGGDSGPSGKT
jgi:cytochrome oxidase Cu insertion factor (SCO1/SenC/PrrC family)